MLDLLDQRKMCYKKTGVGYYQPILVVMSDGMPNGDPRTFHEQTERIRELVNKRRLTVIAVGIGDRADMDTLGKISMKNPPVRLNYLQFREFFAWLSASVDSVTASQTDEEREVDTNLLTQDPWPAAL